jgi:hypothetical protein
MKTVSIVREFLHKRGFRRIEPFPSSRSGESKRGYKMYVQYSSIS